MAIENAKTLNVRIKNKYDSYENWAKSSIVLEYGEIAVAYTTVDVEVGNGKIEQHPELLMKVGDGTKTFSALPWLSAKAADVAAWAKAEKKPTYAANEITGIADYIKDYVEDTMGITVDSNTVYRTVKVNDYEYKLQSKGATDADTAWADVEGCVITIPNDTKAIEDLGKLVGALPEGATEGNVVDYFEGKIDDLTGGTKVSDAINKALFDGENAKYAAASHNHTKSEITDFDHTHTKDEITDFAHTHEIGDVNGLSVALAGKVEAETGKSLVDNNEITKLAGVSTGANKVEASTANGSIKIDGVDTVVYTHPEKHSIADVTGLETALAGKQDTIAANTYDTYGSAAKALEDANKHTDDELDRLVGDETVGTQISTAIDELKLGDNYAAKDHKHVMADITDSEIILAGKVDVVDGKGLSENDLTNTLKGQYDAAYAHSQVAHAPADAQANIIESVKVNGTALDITDKAVDITVPTKVGDLTNDAGYLVAGDIASKAEKSVVDTLVGEDAGKSARTIANEELAAQLLSDKADASFKTLQELATWIEDHPEDAAEINERLDALEGAVDTETTVAEQISTALDNALKVEGAEGAKVEKYALATDLATTNGEVAKKANDADLAAIAKTGSTDDLVQGELVLIFDCGNSGVTAAE